MYPTWLVVAQVRLDTAEGDVNSCWGAIYRGFVGGELVGWCLTGHTFLYLTRNVETLKNRHKACTYVQALELLPGAFFQRLAYSYLIYTLNYA